MTIGKRAPRNGYVILKEYIRAPKGVQVISVYGMVTICAAKDELGFDTHDRESNWFAYIEGKKDQMAILGCQVRAFHFTDEVPTHPDTLVLG
jgi:hypothetical protein